MSQTRRRVMNGRVADRARLRRCWLIQCDTKPGSGPAINPALRGTKGKHTGRRSHAGPVNIATSVRVIGRARHASV